MKHPKICFDENRKPIITGDFEFEIDQRTFADPHSFEPWKKISFAWSPEIHQDIEVLNSNNSELYEVIGKKLKQDFIKLLKTPMPQSDIIKI